MLLKLLITLGLVAAGLTQDASKVKITLYYETLCPYSIDFINDQLYPTYQKVKDIMDVEVYAFGNAQYYPKPDGDGYTFHCQHGSNECKGNMVHACAKKHFTDVDNEVNFVNCLVQGGHAAQNGAKCANQYGINWEPIEQCVNSVEGEKALHDIALKQEKLDPKLYFVPWILVNDSFSMSQVSDCQDNLLKVVCDKYQGQRPAACP